MICEQPWSPFTDQNPELSRPIRRLVLSVDKSDDYEVDAAAPFELESGAYAVTVISGCSVWPEFGTTSVYEARTVRQAIEDAYKGEHYREAPKSLRDAWLAKRAHL